MLLNPPHFSVRSWLDILALLLLMWSLSSRAEFKDNSSILREDAKVYIDLFTMGDVPLPPEHLDTPSLLVKACQKHLANIKRLASSANTAKIRIIGYIADYSEHQLTISFEVFRGADDSREMQVVVNAENQDWALMIDAVSMQLIDKA